MGVQHYCSPDVDPNIKIVPPEPFNMANLYRITQHAMEQEKKSKQKYEYKHLAKFQFGYLKDEIVEAMNEGWECHGAIEKDRGGYQAETLYSQIMKKLK